MASTSGPSRPPGHQQQSPDDFQVGDRVVLCGLKSASHLNGRHGHIGFKPPHDASRFPVHLDCMDPDQPRLAVLAANLKREEQPSNIMVLGNQNKGGRSLPLQPLQTQEPLKVESTSTADPSLVTEPPTAPVARGCLDGHYAEALSIILDVVRLVTAREISDNDDDNDDDLQSLQDLNQLHKVANSSSSRKTKSSTVLNDNNNNSKARRAAATRLDTLLTTAWSDWSRVKDCLKQHSQMNWPQLDATNNIDDDSDQAARQLARLALDDKLATQSWDLLIQGDFWVIGGDSNGTYLIPLQNEDMVYQSVGITAPLHHAIQSKYFGGHKKPPIMVWRLRLLPFYGRLVCDGVVKMGGTEATVARGLAMSANELKTRRLHATVQEARHHGRVIRRLLQLDLEWIKTAQQRVEAATISAQTESVDSESVENLPPSELMSKAAGLLPTKNDPECDLTTVLESRLLETFAVVDHVVQAGQPMGLWFFRRFGYTDDDNPDRMGLIVSQRGPPAGFFRCSGPQGQPTALDVLTGAVEAVTESAKKTGDKTRPGVLVVDDLACHERLQFLFEQANVKGTVVQYYRPDDLHEQDI